MTELQEIVNYLDGELNVSSINDYPGAMNGLQLENNGEVRRIFSAVDASLAVVRQAAESGNGLLIVHHGMFWQGARPLAGSFYQKIKAAMEGNLAIYSSHLPLDVHPKYGNNVLLAKAIGLVDVEPILAKEGVPSGVVGGFRGSLGELESSVAGAVGRGVTLCPGGTNQISRVAVITGGAGSEVAEIARLGIGTFVTGEGPHWSYVEGQELGVNVIYAGHYATETFGVEAISDHLARLRGIDSGFIAQIGGL